MLVYKEFKCLFNKSYKKHFIKINKLTKVKN